MYITQLGLAQRSGVCWLTEGQYKNKYSLNYQVNRTLVHKPNKLEMGKGRSTEHVQELLDKTPEVQT